MPRLRRHFQPSSYYFIDIPEQVPIQGTRFQQVVVIDDQRYGFEFEWNPVALTYSMLISRDNFGTLTQRRIRPMESTIIRGFSENINAPDAKVKVIDMSGIGFPPMPSTLGTLHQVSVTTGKMRR